MKARVRLARRASLALLAMSSLLAFAQQPGTHSLNSSANSAKNPVHEILLPQYPPEIKAGPNLDVFQSHCLLCHSARYVTMQPRFSRAVWEKEVKKMADVYGALISPAEQQQIVEYLVAVQGPAEAK
jgi:cytochrome c5